MCFFIPACVSCQVSLGSRLLSLVHTPKVSSHPIASTLLLYYTIPFVLSPLVCVLAIGTTFFRVGTCGPVFGGASAWVGSVLDTRVAPIVQQRQPMAVVKQVEEFSRRAGVVARVASACASKQSSASGGLGLATSLRTSVHLGLTTLCRATRRKWA